MTSPTTSATDAEVVEQVRQLDAKATKGWAYAGTIQCVVDESDAIVMDASTLIGTELREFRRDMDFVIASRTLLPDLATRLTTANATIESLRKESAKKDREIEAIVSEIRDAKSAIGDNQPLIAQHILGAALTRIATLKKEGN